MIHSRYSLYTTISAVVIAVVVLVMAIHSAVGYFSAKNRIIDDTKSHTKNTIFSLKKNVANYIEAYAVNEYEVIIRNEMNYQGFFAIIVKDYSMGEVLGLESYTTGWTRDDAWNVVEYAPNNDQQNSALEDCFFQEESNILSLAGKTIGSILICSSDRSVNLELRKTVKNSLINTFFISFLLIASLFVTIHRIVLKPVSGIVRAVSTTDDSGIPTGVVSAKGAQEITVLSTAISDMINTIRQSQRDLERRNEALKLSERNLAVSEQKKREIIWGTNAGTWEWNIQTGSIEYNERWAGILGYGLEEISPVSSETWTRFAHPDDLRRSNELLEEHFRRETDAYECEIRLRHRDGRWIWVLDRGKVVEWSGEEKPLRMSGTHTDITRRKESEAKLNEMVAALKRSNEELEQFAYVSSHDLQEPLRMVTNYLQLLDQKYRDTLDADAHDYIDFAVDGAKRMSQLIKDLLAYSRVATQENPLVPVDVNAIVARAVDNLRAAVDEAEGRIEIADLPTVLADEVQILSLFQNLIGNAVKYKAPDRLPEVVIGADRSEGNWVFSIRDNGIGIDAIYQDRIFVIFQRLHQRHEYEGTGIGLAVCKRIVERHGGRIWLESEPGKGSTFFFTLPGTE